MWNFVTDSNPIWQLSLYESVTYLIHNLIHRDEQQYSLKHQSMSMCLLLSAHQLDKRDAISTSQVKYKTVRWYEITSSQPVNYSLYTCTSKPRLTSQQIKMTSCTLASCNHIACCTGNEGYKIAVAVYLHDNKVLTINEYKQKLKYIMQTKSYTKLKIIRLGPYLQIEIIGVQCICITWYRLTWHNIKFSSSVFFILFLKLHTLNNSLILLSSEV